ncbi:MAG: HEAT repeat domain-containing protein [Candidatus Moraniibacteriota bacterium]
MLDYAKYVKQMDDADPRLREEAIEILHHAGIRDENIDFKLIDILKNDTHAINKLAAIRFISESGDEKFKETLIEFSSNPNLLLSKRATLGLGKIRA